MNATSCAAGMTVPRGVFDWATASRSGTGVEALARATSVTRAGGRPGAAAPRAAAPRAERFGSGTRIGVPPVMMVDHVA